MDSAGESRDRMIAQATRQALVQDIRRARSGIPTGIITALVGAGIVALVVIVPLGLVMSLLVGGVGLLTIPIGIAIFSRAVATMVTARRKIRELDERALPPARIV